MAGVKNKIYFSVFDMADGGEKMVVEFTGAQLFKGTEVEIEYI